MLVRKKRNFFCEQTSRKNWKSVEIYYWVHILNQTMQCHKPCSKDFFSARSCNLLERGRCCMFLCGQLMRRDPTQLSQTKQQAPLKIRLPAVEVHVIVKKTSSNLNQHGEGAEAKTIGWQWAQYLNRRNQYLHLQVDFTASCRFGKRQGFGNIVDGTMGHGVWKVV